METKINGYTKEDFIEKLETIEEAFHRTCYEFFVLPSELEDILFETNMYDQAKVMTDWIFNHESSIDMDDLINDILDAAAEAEVILEDKEDEEEEYDEY